MLWIANAFVPAKRTDAVTRSDDNLRKFSELEFTCGYASADRSDLDGFEISSTAIFEPDIASEKIDFPIAPRTGRTFSMVRASPPAMIANVPSMARLTPPETGASMNSNPAAMSSSPSCFVPTGADELMSITTAPGAR